VRRVRPTGEIKWRGDFVFVSEVVAGEPVGIAETGNGNWIVRFCDLDLGVIDRKTGKLHRFAAPRPGRGRARAEQTGENCHHVAGP
jgi:putative transposase